MKINWLRKILNSRKKQTSTDVAKINTSLTYIPKIEELDNESKNIVLNYYEKLNVYNYESLVKFSYDLVKKVDQERDMLIDSMSKYHEIISNYHKDKKNEDYIMGMDYHYAMLSKEEYKIIVDEIINTRKEVTLRYMALNMLVEKEKKDAKNPFNRQKRVMAKLELNGLINEQERLLTFITCIDQVCTAVFNTINNNIILNQKQNVLLDNLDENEMYYNIHTAFSEELKKIRKYYPGEIKEWLLNELYNMLVKEYKDKPINSSFGFYNNIVFGAGYIEDAIKRSFIERTDDWEWLIYTAPRNVLDKVYALLAKASYKTDIYLKEHFYDYEKIYKEMCELINIYKSTNVVDWDKDYLKERFDYFSRCVTEYISLYGRKSGFPKKRIDSDKEDELEKKLEEVGFLHEVIFGHELTCNSFYKPNMVHNWKGNKFSYIAQDTQQLNYSGCNYFNELLINIENKYNVKFPMIEYFSYVNKLYNESCGYSTNIFYNLYQLLNGDTDFINIYYKSTKEEKLYKYMFANRDNQEGVKQYFAPFGASYCYRHPYQDQSSIYYKTAINYNFDRLNKYVSLEELFYTTKYISPHSFTEPAIYNIDHLPKTENFHQIYKNGKDMNDYYSYFLALIEEQVLKNKYDPRIEIVPRSIIFDKEIINKIKKQESIDRGPNPYLFFNNKAEAVYITTYNQFTFLYEYTEYALKNTNIRFIFVDEDVYNRLIIKPTITPSGIKVIPVPKLNHYYEISDYLNKELRKEDEENLKRFMQYCARNDMFDDSNYIEKRNSR